MKKLYDSFSPINYRERSDSASSEEGKAEMKIDDKLALGFRGSMLKNHKVD
jgi:hypothetical protein